MKRGWVKLYRSIEDNHLWRDQSAYRVFSWLLMNVDRHTGKITTGRKKMATACGLKESTIYITTKRLQTQQRINIESNNHFSTISIVNWYKYQDNDNSEDNKDITKKQQPHNTKQEVRSKNKEEDYGETTVKIATMLGIEPTRGMDEYVTSTYKGFKLKDETTRCREWCENNNKPLTSLRWMNWVRKAHKSGDLERLS